LWLYGVRRPENALPRSSNAPHGHTRQGADSRPAARGEEAETSKMEATCPNGAGGSLEGPLPAAIKAGSVGLDRRRVLSRSQAQEVYDANGRKDLVKDSESVYGGPATQALLAAMDLTNAGMVYEFGHGSGRLARRLLERELPESCTYVGVDQSQVMHSLAAERLRPFRSRATLLHTPDGDPSVSSAAAGLAPGSADVFISTYVLDLLSEEDISKVLELAGWLLRDGGQLCLTGLTYGSRVGPLAALATYMWEAVHFLRPKVVGGCRAQTLEDYLGPLWEPRSSTVVSGGLVASEVMVCIKRCSRCHD